jgi:hypothetical protein
MARIARLIVITVALFLIAWVIKEVFGPGQTNKTDDLVQKIRMNGV